MTPNQLCLIIFSFLGAALVTTLVPLYWRARNWPVLLCIFWLAAANFVDSINAILWFDNVAIKATAWCELASRVDFVSTLALEVATVLLLRRLEAIAATRVVTATRRSARRQAILELGIGFGLPITYLVLAAVSQGHRFDIAEELGCMVYIYVTPVAIALTVVPPLIASVVALIYAVLCIRWLVQRRQQFKAVLHASASGIDKSHYIRLFALTITSIVFTIPNAWIITMNNFLNTTVQIQPYTSWASVHSFYDRIVVYPMELINMDRKAHTWYQFILTGRWAQSISCFLCFAYLGTSKECRRLYSHAARRILASVRSRRERGEKGSVSNLDTYDLDALHAEKSMPNTLESPKLSANEIESLEYIEAFSPQTLEEGLQEPVIGKIRITVQRSVHSDL